MPNKKFKSKYRVDTLRLPKWDYGWYGNYFVTICTDDRKHFFGEIINAEMQLNGIGQIAHNCWAEIPIHNPGIFIDEFVIMPNHIHGIIVIDQKTKNPAPNASSSVSSSISSSVEAFYKTPLPPTGTKTPTETQSTNGLQPINKSQLQKRMSEISPKTGQLGFIIRSFKSAVTRLGKAKYPEFKWQNRFYDHIIRDDRSLVAIQRYIKNNPQKWDNDRNNPMGLKM